MLRTFGCLVLQAPRTLILFVFEPSDVFSGISEALQAGFEDGGIGDLMKRRVSGMVRLLVGVVASRIVTANHGPARLIGGVFSGGVQKIAMEEEHVAGVHLGVDQRETLEDSGDTFFVG